MKMVLLLLTACLAVLADLLVPQQIWVNQSCCRSSVALIAPHSMAFCAMPSMTAMADEGGNGSAGLTIERPSCCTSTDLTLRLGATQAVELPEAVQVPVAPLALPAPEKLAPKVIAVCVPRAALMPAAAGPPPLDGLWLRYSRLNL